LVSVWCLIIGVGAVLTLAGASGPVAVFVGAAAVIGLAIAASKH
jgi:hypothetical protein